MGRLIDGAIQPMLLTNYILERKNAFAKALEKGDNDFLFAMLMDYFDAQPTAYNPSKVMVQLEKVAFERYENDGMGGERVLNLDDVTEIVRGGGLDG